jgi:tetratricopeptide (TPR) repeat protein
MGSPEAAVSELLARQGDDPANPVPYIYLGQAYQALGQHALAENAFRQAIAVAPGAGWPHEAFGNYYRDRKDWAMAVAEYTKSVQVEPRRGTSYQSVISILQDQLQNLPAELVRYEQLRGREPKSLWIYGMLGAAYTTLGRVDDAIAAYRQMIALDPGNADAHYRLAYAYMGKGLGQMALAEYQVYVSLVVSGGYVADATYLAQVLSSYAITSPSPNARLHGRVVIWGTATHPNFQFYKVEYGFGKQPDRWFSIGDVVRTPVIDGALAVWDVTGLPAGEYALRLTVVDNTANYPPPYEVPVTIQP